MTRLRGANGIKRIALIYLANGKSIEYKYLAILLANAYSTEIVQQSKARRKEDFLIAFSPIIADATVIAYKGSNSDVQDKIRRVVEVWRARQIFDEAIQSNVEKKIDGKTHSLSLRILS